MGDLKPEKPAPAPATILVIEDDAQFRGFLRELLEQEGYRLCEASNGKEGCERFQDSRPDLVLTDLVMPVMDGVELIMALRKRDTTTPIIAMSGGNRGYGAAYLDVADKLGAQAVLEKPMAAGDLLATIARLLNS